MNGLRQWQLSHPYRVRFFPRRRGFLNALPGTRRQYLGQSQCVEGGVLRVDRSEGAFLLIFSNEADTFYGVSLDLDLSDLAGKCVRIVGTIETYKGRPAILIESRDQLLPCLGKE